MSQLWKSTCILNISLSLLVYFIHVEDLMSIILMKSLLELKSVWTDFSKFLLQYLPPTRFTLVINGRRYWTETLDLGWDTYQIALMKCSHQYNWANWNQLEPINNLG